MIKTLLIYGDGYREAKILDRENNVLKNPTIVLPQGSFKSEKKEEIFNLGTNGEKIFFHNATQQPIWDLSIYPASTKWFSDTDSYEFNGTPEEGKMYLNPTNIVIKPSAGCSNTGISNLIEKTDFQNEVTIVSGSETANANCSWYIEGILFEQTIPARQPVGIYNLQLMLTII